MILISSIEFIFERKLGVNPANNEFPEIEAWMSRTKEEAAYQKAVKKTGYTLEGNFKK
jgi:hypothetical protein